MSAANRSSAQIARCLNETSSAQPSASQCTINSPHLSQTPLNRSNAQTARRFNEASAAQASASQNVSQTFSVSQRAPAVISQRKFIITVDIVV